MNLFIFIFFSTEFYQQETQFFSINVEISLDFNKVSNEKRSQKKKRFFPLPHSSADRNLWHIFSQSSFSYSEYSGFGQNYNFLLAV